MIVCHKCKASSATSDYCDQCGAKVEAAGPSGGAPSIDSLAVAASRSTPQTERACPNCGSDRGATDVFCEVCGLDYATNMLPTGPALTSIADPIAPVATATSSSTTAAPTGSLPGSTGAPRQHHLAWELTISCQATSWAANPELHGDVPMMPAPQVVPLVTAQVLLGRTSRSRGVTPDIDLRNLSGDPAVSHRHARLTLMGGNWELVDLGSENGTSLNGRALAPNITEKLKDGDVIVLGAWTEVTIRSRTS